MISSIGLSFALLVSSSGCWPTLFRAMAVAAASTTLTAVPIAKLIRALTVSVVVAR